MCILSFLLFDSAAVGGFDYMALRKSGVSAGLVFAGLHLEAYSQRCNLKVPYL